MPNEQAKEKLRVLGTRVQGRSLNAAEQRQVEEIIEARRPSTREAVKGILAESLGRSPNEVRSQLASHDDSDRLIDDIINLLGK